MKTYAEFSENRAEYGLAALSPLTETRLNEISTGWSGVPLEYLDFLREVGAGPLLQETLMIYDGLVDPDEVLFDALVPNKSIFLFADDMQGISFGFDLTDGGIVEIDSSDMKVRKLDESFATFIRNRILSSLMD